MTNSCQFELTPLDQSSVAKDNSLVNINYTSQDFYSIKSRVRNLIKEQFPDDFNDFIESSLAFLLIEPQAFMFDTLSFKIDQLVNEIFIETVTEPDNAFRIARQLGFTPTPPIAAKAMFSANINTALPGDLVIPAGSAVETTANGRIITYELFPADSDDQPIFDEDILIQTGDLSNTSIVGVEGKTYTNTFTGTGLSNQSCTLANSPVIFDSISVIVDGVTWSQVSFFTDSLPRQEYRVEFDSDFVAYVIFGNTKSGLFPSSGSNISITYRVGGGTDGNIVSGAISTYRSFDLEGFGIATAVNFTNYTASNFAYNGDTIDDIKNKLPAYLATQDRIVSSSDYQIFADQYVTAYNGQIGKSVAVLRNYGCAANVIDLYVLALLGEDGLQEASIQLKDALLSSINEKKMMGAFVCIRDGVIISTDVSIDVALDKVYRKSQDEIQNKINQATTDFFRLANWQYEQSLQSNDLIKFLSSIKEVNSFTITFTTNDPDNSGSLVTARYYEIIRPDTISISFTFE